MQIERINQPDKSPFADRSGDKVEAEAKKTETSDAVTFDGKKRQYEGNEQKEEQETAKEPAETATVTKKVPSGKSGVSVDVVA